MPLTVSHPAAVLPLARLLPRLPLAALVIGSMSPDFEYLLRLAPRGRFGHTPAGLLLFCLPAGWLAWEAWRRRVGPALLRCLPEGAETLLAPAPSRPRATERMLAAAAVLLGAATHVAWDGLTHRDGWAVEAWGFLGAEMLPGIPWWRILQQASTLGGGAFLLLRIRRWWRELPPDAREWSPTRLGRARRTGSILLAAAAAGAILNGGRAPTAGLAPLLGYAAVGAMTAFTAGCVIFLAVLPRTGRASG